MSAVGITAGKIDYAWVDEQDRLDYERRMAMAERKRAMVLATAILDGSARGDEAQELARWVVAELGSE